MGKINSNMFEIDLENLITSDSTDEIVNKLDEKINVEEVYKNFSDLLSSGSKNSRSNITLSNNLEFQIIDITKDNFSENQYNILNHKQIALKVDDNIHSFLTPDNIIYRLSDLNLINIIMNTPRPRKIVYDSYCSTPSVYSMQLLANIIENIKSNTISELISSYGFEYTDYFNALNILLKIYQIYEKLIYKYQYNPYINYEHRVYKIFNNISFDIDNDLYQARLEECNSSISILNEKLNLKYIQKYDEFEFLNYITNCKDNNLIYPTLDSNLLHCIGLNNYADLINLLSEKRFLESINDLSYDTYYNTLINSCIPRIDRCTNKIIIKGSYKNLFQNMLAELLNDNELIEIVNANKNLFSEILLSNNIETKENIIILLEWALIAYIEGCTEPEELKMYFYLKKKTILSDDDIKYIINLLNNKLNKLTTLIDMTSSSIGNNKLILHENTTSLNRSLLKIKRRIIKDLIIDVNDYIHDFNNKNKCKINFIGFSKETIYLECEEASLNVAIDTLTRTLVKIYDKHLLKTAAHCFVEKINI